MNYVIFISQRNLMSVSHFKEVKTLALFFGESMPTHLQKDEKKETYIRIVVCRLLSGILSHRMKDTLFFVESIFM